MMVDNIPHDGQDASNFGSPGSETSQQETFPNQFLTAEGWAAHIVLDAPLQQPPLPHHHSVHPHLPSHQASERPKSPQAGTHAEQPSTHTPHPSPVQPDNFSTSASRSRHANTLKAPDVSHADCQHQELMQTPGAAMDDAALKDDWYDKLQSLDSSDSDCSHYSIGDESPLSILADSGYRLNTALVAALSATSPVLHVSSRAEILAAVDNILELDVAAQLRHAQPAQEEVLQPPAVVHRQNIPKTRNPRVNGRKGRKRLMTTEEQVPEAVQHHDSRHTMTRPTASPTAVNQPHAVFPHPHQLQQQSAAAHVRAGVQRHEHHEPVQQAQADALAPTRGGEPRRKRRKTAGIAFSAARLTHPTALSTAAATQAAPAHFPMPDEVPAAAAATAPAAASTAASAAATAAASAAAVAAQPLGSGMARPAEVQYQQGDVVWAKLGSDPYWPARVSPVPCIWYLA